MEQEVSEYFNRQGRRSNGLIIPVEGVPRRSSSVSSNLTPTVLKSSTSQSQEVSAEYINAFGSNSTTNQPVCNDFDDLISHVGTNGKYQQALLYYVIAPLSALQPILAYNAVFMLFIPDHWCSGPDMKNWNDTEEYKLVNIPLVNGTDGRMKYSSCTMYGPSRKEIKCHYGWEYEKTDYKQTMVSQYGWVCDDAQIPTYVLLASTVGNAIGIFINGLLSDNWGRKPTLFLAIIINIVFRLISLFSGPHWYFLCIAQFFIGSTTTALYVGPALIGAELCNKDDRAEVYAMTWTVCLIGICLLPFISWLCSDWFLIGLVTSGIGCLTLFYYPVLPESPRWLLQKGRVDEAAAILKRMQNYNNRHAKKKTKGAINSREFQGSDDKGKRKSSMSATENNPDYIKCLLKQVLDRQHNAEERLSIAEGRGAQLEDRSKATMLFTKKNLAKNTLMLTICWSMNTLIYSTMTYNSTHMSGSHFKNFFLLGIIEVPSGFFGGYSADTLGRRWTQSLSFGLCALTCFATSIMVHQRELEVLLATLSKLVITVSFLVAYCQAAELFPTELRSTGSGIASTVGNFVCIVAPVISELSTYSAAYPWIVMGTCATIGMIAATYLPETLNLGLPETIEDANNIGKNTKFWSVGAANKGKGNRTSIKHVELD